MSLAGYPRFPDDTSIGGPLHWAIGAGRPSLFDTTTESSPILGQGATRDHEQKGQNYWHVLEQDMWTANSRRGKNLGKSDTHAAGVHTGGAPQLPDPAGSQKLVDPA